MKTTKLLSRIFSFVVVGFMLADITWYAKTGHAYVDSTFLLIGTIAAGFLFVIFNSSYLVQAKKTRELKLFFVGLLLSIIVIGTCSYLA